MNVEPVNFDEVHKHFAKSKNVYIWNYEKGGTFDYDCLSSPSESSLEFLRPGKVSPIESLSNLIKAKPPPPNDIEKHFVEYPKNKDVSSNIVPYEDIFDNKAESICKFSNNKGKIDYFSKKKDLPPCELLAKVEQGYKPDLQHRADLHSLYNKIQPKNKTPGDPKNSCKYCQNDEPPSKEQFHPYNHRQLDIIKNFTPKDHEKCTLKEKHCKAINTFAEINTTHYGLGPIHWVCKRDDETWTCKGELKKKQLLLDPNMCPTDSLIDHRDTGPIYLRLLSLTDNEKELLKNSWKNRGINRYTLMRIWVTKMLISKDLKLQDTISDHLDGHLMVDKFLQLMFFDKVIVKYIKMLSDIFNLMIKNLDYCYYCTNLIYNLGMIHLIMELESGHFQMLKTSLLETFIENFYPSMQLIERKAWKKLLDIMFYIMYDLFSWKHWPPEIERPNVQFKSEEEEDLYDDSTYSSCEESVNTWEGDEVISGERDNEEQDEEDLPGLKQKYFKWLTVHDHDPEIPADEHVKCFGNFTIKLPIKYFNI